MIYTTLNTTTPMYKFNVDRDKAQSLNVPVSSVFSALQTFLGGYEINDLNNFGRTWKVVMQLMTNTAPTLTICVISLYAATMARWFR